MSVERSVINDPKFGRVEVIKHANGMAMTNGHFGGWVKDRNGHYISEAAAQLMNRAQRRKRGIKL